jgi:hypothetical protein
VRRAAAAPIVAVLIAGCGSSVLSDRQLRSDATRVCAVTLARLNRISVPSSPTGGEPFLRRGTKALRPEITALRKLSPPEQLQSSYGRALGALRSQLAEMDRTDARLRRGADPVETFHTLAGRLAPLEAQANAAWSALQIPACAER